MEIKVDKTSYNLPKYDGFFFVLKDENEATVTKKKTTYFRKYFTTIFGGCLPPFAIVDTSGHLNLHIFFDECKDPMLHANRSPHRFGRKYYIKPG